MGQIIGIIVLNMLPTVGPSRARIIITANATNNIINAYSTNPWPLLNNFSDNIYLHLLSSVKIKPASDIIERL